MAERHEFLYLSRADVEQVGLSMAETIEAVRLALLEKAAARAVMPPKHWLAHGDRRFFSAMSSILPRIGVGGCKWQSGSADNHGFGQPYITGQFILNDLATGLPRAIMDSTFLTAQRTAAASAVAAQALANPNPVVLGVLGCGVQARRNLEALRLAFPLLSAVAAYDIDPAAITRYRAEMERAHGVKVTTCASPREAFEEADLVLTCGPITPAAAREASVDWLRPGATVITLDYDCYFCRGALAGADGLFTDDVGQLEHAKEHGYFEGLTAMELGPFCRPGDRARRSARDRLVSINMGVAVADTATAVRIHERAVAMGIGTPLPI